ncbi:MAG: phosphoribosylformylglycinamidine synthase subunit PurL, partial [Mycobacterium sp.]|nr:phosphoribosylformylglycinamidine synthase subunit PurL [Mycobacterium sp.]
GLRATLLALLGSPHLCSRAFITEQYDRYVRGNTVLAEHADGGVLRIDEATGRGVAVSTDASGRYTFLDPYTGAQLALAEAYRNVAVTGASPVAVTNCLNFGSPEDPGVMWQFSQAVRGLADGCAALGIPVTGGNVSFYNQTGTTAILPTPVVGVLGVIDDVRRRIPTGFGHEPGETLILLGDTRDEFDGSIWAQVTADHLGGLPPKVDLAREQLLAEVLVSASRDGLISAAHDLSEGGLVQAVVEAAMAGETGCRITIPERFQDDGGPFTFLFSESAGRVLVAVPRTEESRFRAMCEARGLPADRIGVVDEGSTSIEVQGQFTVSLDELRRTSEGVLPGLFG